MKIIFALQVVLVILFLKEIKGMVYVHNEKKWAFEILDILFTTSNEELVRIDLKTEYINRTTVGASGTLELRYEVSEDTMIEMLMYRSTSGNADSYQLLLYRIPRMKLYDYLDTYYKNGLKSCSNFPVIETEARDYKFCKVIYLERCLFTYDFLPNYMPEGYYKLIAAISGEADWSLTVLFHPESMLS